MCGSRRSGRVRADIRCASYLPYWSGESVRPRGQRRDHGIRPGRRNRLSINTLQSGRAAASKLLSLQAMLPLLTALVLALQVGVPSPRPAQTIEPVPCVTCHRWTPDTAHPRPPSVDPLPLPPFPYPYRYAPGARVVVTPRTDTLHLQRREPAAERLVPRLQRRKPPAPPPPRRKTDGSPGITLRR